MILLPQGCHPCLTAIRSNNRGCEPVTRSGCLYYSPIFRIVQYIFYDFLYFVKHAQLTDAVFVHFVQIYGLLYLSGYSIDYYYIVLLS